jgi:2-dehydropantoate 2-reductase
MKIVVVGAGGVGGFLAVMLSRLGEDVYIVARGKQLKAISKNGICVELNGESICSKPKMVSDDPADFKVEADVVLFCTKGYDLESALELVSPVVSKDTLLVPLGNGVGNAKVLKHYFGNNSVANGAIYIVSHIKEPGVVTVKGKGAFVVIGEDGEISKSVQKLGEALQNSGIKVKLSNSITTDVWKKYLLISAMATLTSYYDEPMGAIVEKHSDKLDAILHEILAVGRAEGAELNFKDIENVISQVKKVPYSSPTSMWLDFKAGRETELEQLSGYIVKKAKEHNIDVPVMSNCYEKLKSF